MYLLKTDNRWEAGSRKRNNGPKLRHSALALQSKVTLLPNFNAIRESLDDRKMKPTLALQSACPYLQRGLMAAEHKRGTKNISAAFFVAQESPPSVHWWMQNNAVASLAFELVMSY